MTLVETRQVLEENNNTKVAMYRSKEALKDHPCYTQRVKQFHLFVPRTRHQSSYHRLVDEAADVSRIFPASEMSQQHCETEHRPERIALGNDERLPNARSLATRSPVVTFGKSGALKTRCLLHKSPDAQSDLYKRPDLTSTRSHFSPVDTTQRSIHVKSFAHRTSVGSHATKYLRANPHLGTQSARSTTRHMSKTVPRKFWSFKTMTGINIACATVQVVGACCVVKFIWDNRRTLDQARSRWGQYCDAHRRLEADRKAWEEEKDGIIQQAVETDRQNEEGS